MASAKTIMTNPMITAVTRPNARPTVSERRTEYVTCAMQISRAKHMLRTQHRSGVRTPF